MKYEPLAHHRATVSWLVAGALVSSLFLSVSAFAAQGPARPVAVFQFNSDVAEIPPHVAWNAFSTALVKTGIFTVVTQNPAMAQYAFDGFVTEVKAGQGKIDVKGVLKGFFVNTGDEQSGVRVEIKVLDVKTGQILDTIGVSSADMKSKFGLADVGAIIQGLTSKGQSSSGGTSTRARKDVMDEAFANCIVEAVNKISTQAAQYQNMASAIPPSTNQQPAPSFGAVPPTYGQQPGYNPSYNQPAPGYPSSPGYPPGQAPMAGVPPGYSPNQPAYGYPPPTPPQGFPPTAGGGTYPPSQPPAYGYPPQMGPAVGAYPPPAPEQAYPPTWGGAPGSPPAQQPVYGYPPSGAPQGGPTTGAYPPPPPPSPEFGYPPTARSGGSQGYPSNQPAVYGHPPGSSQPGIPEYPSAPPPMPGYGGQPGYPPNVAGPPGYPQPGYPPQQMPPGAAFPPQGGAYPPQGQAPPPGWR
jgi:curli biogenesis system outer membrane secretion channel CsgG